jgi:hypothetical protein
MEVCMQYVTMIDVFLSNWGEAKGKINMLIFPCETLEEAEVVVENARNRSDMKNIKTTQHPKQLRKNQGKDYVVSGYYVQIKDKNEHPNWYKKGYFKKAEKC